MTTHHHSTFEWFFLGSNTDYLLHHLQVPLFVYRQSQPKWERVLAVPLDFTDTDTPLLQWADEWAQDDDLTLHFLYVLENRYRHYLNSDTHCPDEAVIVAKIQQKITDYIESHDLEPVMHFTKDRRWF